MNTTFECKPRKKSSHTVRNSLFHKYYLINHEGNLLRYVMKLCISLLCNIKKRQESIYVEIPAVISNSPISRNDWLLCQRNISLEFGTTRSTWWDIRIWMLPFGQLGLSLGNDFFQFIGIRDVLISLELGSYFDSFSSVCVELERRVKCCSQSLSEQGSNPFTVCLSERKNWVAHFRVFELSS